MDRKTRPGPAGGSAPLSPPRSNTQTPAHSPPKDPHRTGPLPVSSGILSPLSPVSPARPLSGSAANSEVGFSSSDSSWNNAANNSATRGPNPNPSSSQSPIWVRTDQSNNPATSLNGRPPPKSATSASYGDGSTESSQQQQQQQQPGRSRSSTTSSIPSKELSESENPTGAGNHHLGNQDPSRKWNGKQAVSGGSQTTTSDEAGPLRSVTFSSNPHYAYPTDRGVSGQPQTGSNRSPTLAGGPPANAQIPQGRQSRSFSFALGQHDSDFFGPTSSSSASPAPQTGGGQGGFPANNNDVGGFQQRLAPMPEGPDSDDFGLVVGSLHDPSGFTLPKLRSRSKSSAAAYGLPVLDGMHPAPFAPLQQDQLAPLNNSFTNGPAYHTHRASLSAIMANSQVLNSIWRDDGRGGGEYWATTGPSIGASSSGQDANSIHPFNHAPSGMDPADSVLRYSHDGRGMSRSTESEHFNQRRHSVAGPPQSFRNMGTDSRNFSDALGSLHLGDVARLDPANFKPGMIESSLDDYFDNRETRAARVAAATASGTFNNSNNNASSASGPMRAASLDSHQHPVRDPDHHLGKGVPLHAVPHQGPLYIVEFKAGRSDLFYVVIESVNQNIKKGDLVIVEADRGKDLGKVVNDDITPLQVQMLQQRQAEAAAVAEMGMTVPGMAAAAQAAPVKEIHPKRIYRLAQPIEISMLATKNQDEAKAMLMCQTKVQQKNLPMEVVDAEYQWDRRKLTFYFIAERRIDFRELVRDLFKIYKTRIWMCAVNANFNSTSASASASALGGATTVKH